MANNGANQPLLAWGGDIPSLIQEMKRRAGASTDTELAEILGISQSTISTWRRRAAVPESALLRFEDTVETAKRRVSIWRFIAARAIAIRVAGFIAEESGDTEVGLWVGHQTVAMAFSSLVDAIYADLAHERGLDDVATFEVAQRYLGDREYLARFAAWVRGLSIGEVLKREARAGATIEVPAHPVVPQ